mgnify:CR=1 FL=1
MQIKRITVIRIYTNNDKISIKFKLYAFFNISLPSQITQNIYKTAFYMVKNIRYSLDIPRIESLVEEFGASLKGNYNVSFETPTEEQRVIKISKTGDKKPSILRCYIVNGGQVSFRTEGTPAHHSICNKCKDLLIEKAKLEYADRKDFKAVEVEESDFLLLIDCFRDESFGYSVEEKEIHNERQKYAYKVKGRYKDEASVYYYTNRTFHVQGRVSPIFIDLVCQTTGLIGDINIEELFAVEVGKTKIIDEDIKKHIPENYEHIEGKLGTILSSSLLLINRPISLEDYSPYAFPALRVLEGLMKKRIIEECGAFEDFGTYFKKKRGVYVFHNDSKPFANELTCKYLEDAYNLFKKHRDGTFHIDDTIETSRILSYDESIEIVKDCLTAMSNLCRNWD